MGNLNGLLSGEFNWGFLNGVFVHGDFKWGS